MDTSKSFKISISKLFFTTLVFVIYLAESAQKENFA